MGNKKCILKNENGFALVLTLLVTALLSVIILEFAQSVKIDSKIAQNYKAQLESYTIASSGVEFAKYALKGDDPDFDALTEDWAKDYSKILSSVMFKKGKLNLEIVDESSKLNVNTVVLPQLDSHPEKVYKSAVDSLKRLCELTNQDYKFVDALVDWIDENDDVTFFEGSQESGGAEDRYYQSLDPRYRCKNRPLDTVRELFLVKGFTDETYLGNEDKEEKEDDFIKKTGLKDFLTIYGSKININTASPTVLKSLHLDFTDVMADEIITMREENPFKSVNEVQKIKTIPKKVFDKIKSRLDIKSVGFFSVQSVGQVNGFTTVINAILYRASKSEINVVYWKVL